MTDKEWEMQINENVKVLINDIKNRKPISVSKEQIYNFTMEDGEFLRANLTEDEFNVIGDYMFGIGMGAAIAQSEKETLKKIKRNGV